MKKIKLPLEMANGVMARTLDEMKNNWDIGKVMEHLVTGKLEIWLKERYCDELAAEVAGIDKNDSASAQEKLCQIFGQKNACVEKIDISALADRRHRHDLVRQLTSDEKIIRKVDSVAFSQEELNNLIGSGVEEIYLCPGSYFVPIEAENHLYIGLGNVVVSVGKKALSDLKRHNIRFENIQFDEFFTDDSEGIKLYEEAEKQFAKQDFCGARYLFDKAVGNNIADAALKLGMMYYLGLGIKPDKEKSVGYFLKAEKSGLCEATAMLVLAYGYGCGIQNGEMAAWNAWKKANFIISEPCGMAAMGFCYMYGWGVEKNEKQAAEWYRKAAEAGNNIGMNNLGACYANGTGVMQNKKQAAEWYRKAAEAGNGIGMFNLGVYYEDGTGVEQNKKQAAEWYRKAAEAGISDGMNNLGVCYETGAGVEQDKKLAAEWYRKAAEAGNGRGMNNLGFLYLSGTGMEQDEKQAAEWFRKSAETGDSSGMYNLGFCYENGKGIEINIPMARSWYCSAAKNGNKSAKERFGELIATNRTTFGLGFWHGETIEWTILDIQEGKALLLSKHALWCMPYHKKREDITWEKSDLRQWLNETFYRSAFSVVLPGKVLTSNVTDQSNPRHTSVDGGNATQDKVFCLSVNELWKYMKDDEKRVCKATEWLKSAGADVSKDGTCYWWLRSLGSNNQSAAVISQTGDCWYGGFLVDSRKYAVRPAIWIKLDDEELYRLQYIS